MGTFSLQLSAHYTTFSRSLFFTLQESKGLAAPTSSSVATANASPSLGVAMGKMTVVTSPMSNRVWVSKFSALINLIVLLMQSVN